MSETAKEGYQLGNATTALADAIVRADPEALRKAAGRALINIYLIVMP